MKRLQKLGMVTGVPGMAALDMNSAEDAVVRNTREVVPGMVICGMEVCTSCPSPHPLPMLPVLVVWRPCMMLPLIVCAVEVHDCS